MKALAVALLVATCGCSFVMTRGTPRGSPPACSGYAPAVIDATLTAATLALFVKSAIENQCNSNGDCYHHSYDPTGLIVLPMLVLGVSTLVGFQREGSCRAQLTDRVR